MRNLKLKSCQHHFTGLENIRFVLFNPYEKDINGGGNKKRFMVTSNGLYRVSMSFDTTSTTTTSTPSPTTTTTDDAQVELLLEMLDIVGAEFLTMENSICLASALGEVVMIPLPNNDMMIATEAVTMEEVMFCDEGIMDISWSPDQEIVVIATGNYKLATMTSTFDLINEHHLIENNRTQVDGQFVSMGWGRKDTQFHGSEGKEEAKRVQHITPLDPEDLKKLPKVSVNVSEMIL